MFPQECIDTYRVEVEGGCMVKVYTDSWNNCLVLDGIGQGNNPCISAEWLPNRQIRVVFEGSEIRHYTSLNEYYVAGFHKR